MRLNRIAHAALSIVAIVSFVPAASAEIRIDVNQTTQKLIVTVDGVQRYDWPISTARAGYSTPNGTYHPKHLEQTWFSKEYYGSPMPHSIFFHGGYAIHGSYEVNRLGKPASHGCIRLNPAHAATLFKLVKAEGMSQTTIAIAGHAALVGTGMSPDRRRWRSVGRLERIYERPADLPQRSQPFRIFDRIFDSD